MDTVYFSPEHEMFRDQLRRFVVADRSRHERDVPDLDLSPIRRGAVLMIDGHFAAQAALAARLARDRGVPEKTRIADPVPLSGSLHRPVHRA